MKSNIHKKDYQMTVDGFERRYACKNRLRRELRSEKHNATRRTRNKNRRDQYGEEERVKDNVNVSFVEEFVEDS